MLKVTDHSHKSPVTSGKGNDRRNRNTKGPQEAMEKNEAKRKLQ